MLFCNSISRLLIAVFLCFTLTAANAQWTQLKGPEGGSVYRLEKINDEYWAFTLNGLFRSADGGVSWTQDPMFGNFFRVACAAQYSDTVFLYASEALDNTRITRFYTSLDLGQTWTSTELDYDNISGGPWIIPKHIFKIYDVLFMEDGSNILRSLDQGLTWEHTIGDLNQSCAFDDQHIISATPYVVSISEDLSFTHKFLLDLLPGTYFIDGQIDGPNIFIIRSDSLFVSDDLGQSWTSTRNMNFTYYAQTWKGPGQTIFAINNAHDRYQSFDFGRTWELISDDPIPLKVGIQDAIFDGDTVLVCSFPGIWRSTDRGVNWSRSSEGMFTYVLQQLTNNDQYLYARTLYEVFRSADQGNTWEQILTGGPYTSDLDAQNNEVYAIFNQDQVLYSPDYGTTFQQITDVDYPDFTTYGRFVGDRYYLFAKEKCYAFFGGLLIDSITLTPFGNITGIRDFFEIDGRYLVIPILSGGATAQQLLLSDDKGASWYLSNAFGTTLDGGFYMINGRLFIGGRTFYYSDDKGDTWTKAQMPIPNNALGIVADDNLLFAVNPSSFPTIPYYPDILYSADTGASWLPVSYPYPFDPIHQLYAIHIFNKALYVNPLSAGVWRYTITLPTDEKEKAAPVQYLSISPNPVKTTARISWGQPLASAGELRLFSADGRLLQTLPIAKGTEYFDLSVENRPPGLYFMSLETEIAYWSGQLLKH